MAWENYDKYGNPLELDTTSGVWHYKGQPNVVRSTAITKNGSEPYYTNMDNGDVYNAEALAEQAPEPTEERPQTSFWEGVSDAFKEHFLGESEEQYQQDAAELYKQTQTDMENNWEMYRNRNADIFSQAEKASEDTGVPMDVVRTLTDDGQEDLIKTAQRVKNGYELDSVEKESPVTMNYLSDVDNMAISHDDIPTLQWAENTIHQVTGAFELSSVMHDLNEIDAQAKENDADVNEYGGEEIQQRRRSLIAREKELENFLNPNALSLAGVARMAGDLWQNATTNPSFVVSATAAGALAGATIGQTAIPIPIIGAAIGTIGGAGWGARTAFGVALASDQARQAAGEMYRSLSAQGVSKESAQHSANIVGAANFILGLPIMDKITKSFKWMMKADKTGVFGDLMKGVGTQAAIGAAQGAANAYAINSAGIEDDYSKEMWNGAISAGELGLLMAVPGMGGFALAKIRGDMQATKTMKRDPQRAGAFANAAGNFANRRAMEENGSYGVDIDANELNGVLSTLNEKQRSDVLSSLELTPEDLNYQMEQNGTIHTTVGNVVRIQGDEAFAPVVAITRVAGQPSTKTVVDAAKGKIISNEDVDYDKAPVDNSEYQEERTADMSARETEITEQVHNEPVYVAQRDLESEALSGTFGGQKTLGRLIQDYDQDKLSAEDLVGLENFAHDHGYSSESEMIQAMKEAPNETDEVARRVKNDGDSYDEANGHTASDEEVRATAGEPARKQIEEEAQDMVNDVTEESKPKEEGWVAESDPLWFVDHAKKPNGAEESSNTYTPSTKEQNGKLSRGQRRALRRTKAQARKNGLVMNLQLFGEKKASAAERAGKSVAVVQKNLELLARGEGGKKTNEQLRKQIADLREEAKGLVGNEEKTRQWLMDTRERVLAADDRAENAKTDAGRERAETTKKKQLARLDAYETLLKESHDLSVELVKFADDVEKGNRTSVPRGAAEMISANQNAERSEKQWQKRMDKRAETLMARHKAFVKKAKKQVDALKAEIKDEGITREARLGNIDVKAEQLKVAYEMGDKPIRESANFRELARNRAKAHMMAEHYYHLAMGKVASLKSGFDKLEGQDIEKLASETKVTPVYTGKDGKQHGGNTVPVNRAAVTAKQRFQYLMVALKYKNEERIAQLRMERAIMIHDQQLKLVKRAKRLVNIKFDSIKDQEAQYQIARLFTKFGLSNAGKIEQARRFNAENGSGTLGTNTVDRQRRPDYYAYAQTGRRVEGGQDGVTVVNTQKTRNVPKEDRATQLVNEIEQNSPEHAKTLQQWVDDMSSQGIECNIDDDVFQLLRDVGSGTMDYRDLNIHQFQHIVDAMQSIQRASKMSREMLTDKNNASIDVERSADIGEILNGGKRKYNLSDASRDRANDHKSLKDVLRGIIIDQQNMGTIIWKLANRAPEGTHIKHFFLDVVNTLSQKESVLLRQCDKILHEAWDGYTREEKYNMVNKQIYIKSLGCNMTRQEMIMLALNMGNEENSAKLFGGSINGKPIDGTVPVAFRDDMKAHGMLDVDGTHSKAWTRENVQKVLNDNLTEKDWKAIQKTWDMFDSLWDKMKRKEYERTGKIAVSKTNISFKVTTADGKEIQLKGGYFPLAEDPVSKEAKTNKDAVSAREFLKQASIKRGTSTWGRYKQVTGAEYAVALNPKIIQSYLNEAIHDYYFRDWAADAVRLFNEDFKNALFERGGQAYVNYFDDYINNVIGNDYKNLGADNATVVNSYLRKHASAAAIGLNVGVITQNPANIILFPGAIPGWGWGDTAKAFITYAPKYLGSIFSAKRYIAKNCSPFMQDLADRPDASVTMFINDVFGRDMYKKTRVGVAVDRAENWLAQASAHAMWLTDSLVSVPMWEGAFHKFYGEAVAGGKSEMEARQFATLKADELVRNVNGSPRRYDQSPFLRHKDYKWWNTFMGFFNAEANRWIREVDFDRSKIKNWGKFIGFFAAHALVFQQLSNVLMGKTPNDPGDVVAETFMYPSSFGVLGKNLVAGAGTILGLDTFGYRPPIAFTTLQSLQGVYSAVRQYEDKPTDKNFRKIPEAATRTISYGRGIPMPIHNILWNSVDYANSDIDGLDWLKFLAQGKRYHKDKKKQKK